MTDHEVADRLGDSSNGGTYKSAADKTAAPLWRRIVERDGPWTKVAWTCPGCDHSLLRHFATLGGCAQCKCALAYSEAESRAYEAVKAYVGA